MNSEPLEKQFVEVMGKRMAYAELGAQAADQGTIVFQHGNPTSSYLWRNIMPHVKDLGRCIAIDLIGMGDSEKLHPAGPGAYTFAEHFEYFSAALAALNVSDKVTLVIHDWGSALGFHWACQHPDAVRGICYMEAIVGPFPDWSDWDDGAASLFQAFRSDAGEAMILDKNIFVERVLPGSVLRGLTEAEMAVYRAPFLEAGEDRRPTLTWPRQIPVGGEPADVTAIAQAYSEWLQSTEVPKLFVNAQPGAILTGSRRELARSFPNQTEVTVAGSHFIQEDSPDEIGAALRSWLLGLSKE